MRSRAGRMCDWIEAYCPVPEGALIGEWMTLMPWQRDFLYSVYNNDQERSGMGAFLPEIEQPLDEGDAAALDLALAQCRAESAERSRQIDRLLAERPRRHVAMLACYIMQSKNLDLGPGDTAPCWVIDPDNADTQERAAAKLVRRMLGAGVSQYHPNPNGSAQGGEWRRPMTPLRLTGNQSYGKCIKQRRPCHGSSAVSSSSAWRPSSAARISVTVSSTASPTRLPARSHGMQEGRQWRFEVYRCSACNSSAGCCPR